MVAEQKRGNWLNLGLRLVSSDCVCLLVNIRLPQHDSRRRHISSSFQIGAKVFLLFFKESEQDMEKAQPAVLSKRASNLKSQEIVGCTEASILTSEAEESFHPISISQLLP